MNFVLLKLNNDYFLKSAEKYRLQNAVFVIQFKLILNKRMKFTNRVFFTCC